MLGKVSRKRRSCSPSGYVQTASCGFLVGGAVPLALVLAGGLYEVIVKDKRVGYSKEGVQDMGVLMACTGGLASVGSLCGYAR